MQSPDPNLDNQLRAVPLPEGLAARLRLVALAEDDGLDEAVREVPVPMGLLKQLLYIPLGDDQGLDEALRDVRVPTSLVAKWMRRDRQRGRLMRSFMRLAAAASILLGVGLSVFYLSKVIQVPHNNVVKEEPKSSLAPDPRDFVVSPATESPQEMAARSPLDVPEVRLERIDENAAGSQASDLAQAALPAGVDPLTSVFGSSPYASGDTGGEEPDLKPAPSLQLRGVDWPTVPGFDWSFFSKYGVHPLIPPAANSRLQTNTVPLKADTAGYESACRYVDKKRRPPPKEVRVEDFLAAAVDYDYPRPDRQPLGISVAVAPSPFRGEGAYLLQIGVQAREIPDEHRSPVHLVLAVDNSGSMRWGGRATMVRKALEELAERLQPGDRLSLVAFSNNAKVLIEAASRADARQFIEAAEMLTGDGSTNLAEGLGQAYAVAQEAAAEGPASVRVVLLTDGMGLDPASASRLQRRIAGAAGQGVPLDVIDLSQEKECEQLTGFAKAGRGLVHRAANTSQVSWALREIITGRSQLVARGARLQVTFNPKAVRQYRLLGHEASAAGLRAANPEADFYEGQSATALYEVYPVQGGPNDLASVKLTWYIPTSDKSASAGGLQEAVQKIERRHMATKFTDAPLWLQAAALVAETAEILRDSPFAVPQARNQAPAVRGWDETQALLHVKELAGKLDSRLQQRPSFVEFKDFVDKAAKARPARTTDRPADP
jgi:Ca-activated chloride channel homolog